MIYQIMQTFSFFKNNLTLMELKRFEEIKGMHRIDLQNYPREDDGK